MSLWRPIDIAGTTTTLVYVFVRRRPSGSLARFAWPVSAGDSALVTEGDPPATATLLRALDLAVRNGVTVREDTPGFIAVGGLPMMTSAERAA